MVEIVFDEITRNSLRDEIDTCVVNKVNKNRESISDDILCLGYLLDLGSLNCDLYGDVRKKSLCDLICGKRQRKASSKDCGQKCANKPDKSTKKPAKDNSQKG